MGELIYLPRGSLQSFSGRRRSAENPLGRAPNVYLSRAMETLHYLNSSTQTARCGGLLYSVSCVWHVAPHLWPRYTLEEGDPMRTDQIFPMILTGILCTYEAGWTPVDGRSEHHGDQGAPRGQSNGILRQLKPRNVLEDVKMCRRNKFRSVTGPQVTKFTVYAHHVYQLHVAML